MLNEDLIFVGWDAGKLDDIPVLTIMRAFGRKQELVNIFYGDEAREMYDKMVAYPPERKVVEP